MKLHRCKIASEDTIERLLYGVTAQEVRVAEEAERLRLRREAEYNAAGRWLSAVERRTRRKLAKRLAEDESAA